MAAINTRPLLTHLKFCLISKMTALNSTVIITAFTLAPQSGPARHDMVRRG